MCVSLCFSVFKVFFIRTNDFSSWIELEDFFLTYFVESFLVPVSALYRKDAFK